MVLDKACSLWINTLSAILISHSLYFPYPKGILFRSTKSSIFSVVPAYIEVTFSVELFLVDIHTYICCTFLFYLNWQKKNDRWPNSVFDALIAIPVCMKYIYTTQFKPYDPFVQSFNATWEICRRPHHTQPTNSYHSKLSAISILFCGNGNSILESHLLSHFCLARELILFVWKLLSHWTALTCVEARKDA